MKLTIAVITMNRAAQLKEALESCLACNLPEQTEFVIIDNASTDGTEQTVAALMENCGYPYYYEKRNENLGVGGGRNYAFTKSKGQYVYVLDDDAVISTETGPDFFVKAVDLMDREPRIATMTTQIYDIVWEANRVNSNTAALAEGIYPCKTFCGGSHFLRKAFFEDVPYLPNKYGFEEIPPSLQVMDSGLWNVFVPELMVIHKPKVNKWDWNDERNLAQLTNECAVPYAIKKMMYPRLSMPVLWLAYRARVFKYLRKHPDAAKRCGQIVKETMRNYPIHYRIKLKTLVQMKKDFGWSVF